MSKEDLTYVFIGMVVVVIIVFLNADKVWNSADKTFMPLVNYNADDNTVTAGAGSADANAIKNIHIAWEKGNITISYGTQDRITWKEVFVKGDPTQFNLMYYWMNSETVFINFFSQDYSMRNMKQSRKLRKDLQVFIPKGVVLDEIIAHTFDGTVSCNVQAKKKDLKSMNEKQDKGAK